MKTEYSVFKQVEVPQAFSLATEQTPGEDRTGRGQRTLTAYLLIGAAAANAPKQAIREVVERLPVEERLGSYRAAPTRSWHSAEVTEKPAELAVS